MAAPVPLVVVAGESLIDRIVRPGSAEPPLDVPGGGPFNTARALARLGVRTTFLGRLSKDERGRRLRAALEGDGVELDLAATTDDPTLIAVADVDPTGVATYRFEPEGSAAAGLVPADIPAGLPVETVALHVGTLGLVLEPTATTIARLVADATPDVLVMVDPNVRPAAIRDESTYRARLQRVLARAAVVKASVEDLRWLEPVSSPLDAARALVARGAAVVLVTAGPAAVRVVGRWKEPLIVATPAVHVVDTIGAGDAFGAGFLAAWLQAGRPKADLADPSAVATAAQFAVHVATGSVTRSGAEIGPRRTPMR